MVKFSLLIYLYKSVNNLSSLDMLNSDSLKNFNATRFGSASNLLLPKIHTNYGKLNTTCVAVCNWNSPPTGPKQLPSLSSFKKTCVNTWIFIRPPAVMGKFLESNVFIWYFLFTALTCSSPRYFCNIMFHDFCSLLYCDHMKNAQKQNPELHSTPSCVPLLFLLLHLFFFMFICDRRSPSSLLLWDLLLHI